MILINRLTQDFATADHEDNLGERIANPPANAEDEGCDHQAISGRAAGPMESGVQQSEDGRSPRGARIFLGLVFSVVFFVGLAAGQGGVSLLLKGDPNRIGAYAAVLMGVALVAASCFYFYRAYFVHPLRAARLARVRRQYPDQPWMERPDWAARRVEHSSSYIALGMWIWVIGWWGFISFIGWVNYDKILKALSESWWNGALIGVFVGAGLIGLAFAIRFTVDTFRFGSSTLRIDTLPVHPGETFRGSLEARLDPKPKHPLNMELTCEEVLWITRGHGKDRETRSKVTRLGGSRAGVQTSSIVGGPTGARCPIEISVPADLPEHSIDERGNGVRWVLTVNTTGDDCSFSCAFHVPVLAPRQTRETDARTDGRG